MREMVSVDLRVGPEKPQGGQLIRDVAITRLFSIEVPVYFLLYFLSRLVS